jgi:hypothetical protein
LKFVEAANITTDYCDYALARRIDYLTIFQQARVAVFFIPLIFSATYSTVFANDFTPFQKE